MLQTMTHRPRNLTKGRDSLKSALDHPLRLTEDVNHLKNDNPTVDL